MCNYTVFSQLIACVFLNNYLLFCNIPTFSAREGHLQGEFSYKGIYLCQNIVKDGRKLS